MMYREDWIKTPTTPADEERCEARAEYAAEMGSGVLESQRAADVYERTVLGL